MSGPIPVTVVVAGYFGRLHPWQYAANPAAKLVAEDESLPISEQAANEVLSVPLHPGLSDADLERVIEAVVRAVQ